MVLWIVLCPLSFVLFESVSAKPARHRKNRHDVKVKYKGRRESKQCQESALISTNHHSTFVRRLEETHSEIKFSQITFTLGRKLSSSDLDSVYLVNEDPNIIVKISSPNSKLQAETGILSPNPFEIESLKRTKLYIASMRDQNNIQYIAMKKVKGTEIEANVRAALTSKNRRPIDIVHYFFDILTKDLFKLHSLGIFHGDAHLRNILVTEKGNVFIDFGLSREISVRGFKPLIERMQSSEFRSLSSPPIIEFTRYVRLLQDEDLKALGIYQKKSKDIDLQRFAFIIDAYTVMISLLEIASIEMSRENIFLSIFEKYQKLKMK
jgi:serine/threonine protein kinase